MNEDSAISVVRQHVQQKVEFERNNLRQAESIVLEPKESQLALEQQAIFAGQTGVKAKPKPTQITTEEAEVAILINREITENTVRDVAVITEPLGIESEGELGFVPELILAAVDDEADVTHHAEIGVGVTDIEAGLDLLISDLEDGFERAEAEYVGELLVNVLLETETNSFKPSNEAALDSYLVGVIDTELVKSSPKGHESTNKQDAALLNSYLEELEPAKIEEIRGIIEVLTEQVKETSSNTGLSDVEHEVIQENMYKLAERLFNVLGVEYDGEMLKQCLEIITNEQVVTIIDEEELPIDYLNKMGTQEYKSYSNGLLGGGLTRLIRKKVQPHQLLGKYTLQVSMA